MDREMASLLAAPFCSFAAAPFASFMIAEKYGSK
jgi:hypothetical protein